MNTMRVLMSLILSLSLASCSLMQPSPKLQAPADWSQRNQKLIKQGVWQAKGRIGIKTANQSSSATLIWQQNGTNYDLVLLGPLGQTVASLKQRRGLAELTIPEHPVYQSYDAEAMVAEVLGWQLPINSLPYWLRALDDPNQPAATGAFDAEKRLSSLDSDAWHLEFRSYLQQDDLWLPEKIQVNHPKVQLKLSLKEWTLGLPQAANPEP